MNLINFKQSMENKTIINSNKINNRNQDFHNKNKIQDSTIFKIKDFVKIKTNNKIKINSNTNFKINIKINKIVKIMGNIHSKGHNSNNNIKDKLLTNSNKIHNCKITIK